jgi:hypothetical protein
MTTITLTMEQAKTIFDALDIGLGAAALEASEYTVKMKGYRESQSQRLHDEAHKVSAAVTLLGQLIEDATAGVDSVDGRKRG